MLRFATSPTSDMHINDLRLAIFNYIVSQQRDEDFLVRIEDIDKENNIEDKDKEILDLLGIFSIQYSQVVYQSENVRFHTAMALQLVHAKKAFSCFCSQEWLDKKKKEAKELKKAYKYDDACMNLPDELIIDNTNPFTLRIKRPLKSSSSDDMDSFVILKQDKTPTSNFASAIDDMLSDVSIIICDEDSTYDTQKHEHIRALLNYDKKIEYKYLPIILNQADSPSIKRLLEDGFLPEAILNYLISMGIKSPKEIFTLKEAIEWFDITETLKSPAHFDIQSLRHINNEHLKKLDAKELSRYVGFADEEIGELAKIYLQEVSTTKELKSKIGAIFANKNIPNELLKHSEVIRGIIKAAPYFDKYDDFNSYLMEQSALSAKELLNPLRYILTGAEDGPDIAEIYRYIKNYIVEIV